jgi:hypothetical protein
MLLLALAERLEIADTELKNEHTELATELGVVDLVPLAGPRPVSA